MEEITANRKGNRIRIVLLKEVPQQTPLYDPSRTKSRAPLSHDSTIRSKPNHTSIAYLSSILQDEHLQTEKSTVPLSEEDEGDGVGESFDNLEEFRRKDKKSSRYLSCLLETEGEEHAHSKTEGMERLLRRRRIMPIDKIQPRRKNITFSLKNKRELNKDFQEFVNSKNAISAFREEPPPPARDEQTIAFPIKQYADKRVASLRGERGEKRKRRAMQHLQLLDGNAALPSTLLRKTNVETKEPGYAIAFKRLSSDIPHINSFEWSRLDHHPYHLIKGWSDHPRVYAFIFKITADNNHCR